ncbi:MAG: hypothetical protein Q9191_007487 [Dirinaria sp. TL-2023a]
MSDYEEYSDDDDMDYTYIDEEDAPYAEADILAENAVQSPGWNDNFDATVGEQDPWYDWEWLYPSDFFDEDVPQHKKRRKKQAVGIRQRARSSKGTKRQRLEANDFMREIPQAEPATALPDVVVWRSGPHLPDPIPVFNQGELEKVALLKDWRERYDGLAFFSTFLQSRQKSSKPGFAVVIERRDSYRCDPPRVHLPGGSKSQNDSMPRINGASHTNTSQLTDGAPFTSSLTQKLGPAASTPKKRKKAESNTYDEVEEKASLNAHIPPSQKMKPSSKPSTSRNKRKATEMQEEPDDVKPAAKRKKEPAATAGPKRRKLPTRTSSRKK